MACGSSFDDPGCLHRELDDWCLLDESADGPDGDGRCEGPEPSGYRCGDYDVAVYSGGYTSESHYFDHASGDLVAVRYTTNTCCGGFSY